MSLSRWLGRNRKTLLILIVGGAAIYGLATLKPRPEPSLPKQATLIDVTVVTARPQAVKLIVQSQGTVMPKREIDIVAQVSGVVLNTADHFVSGGSFKADEALVAIDTRDYDLALVRAQGRVAEAEQVLALERGRARQAKREWRDLGSIEANNLSLRRPQLKAAEAQMSTAIADRDGALLDLERTQLKVPFDGRVRETMVNIGQYVSPGTRLARVYDTRVAQIRLPLTGEQAALIDLPVGVAGAHPKVTITGSIAGVEEHWQGKVVRTEATIDTRSRFYYVVAEVEQPYRLSASSTQAQEGANESYPLLIGMFVEAAIEGKRIDGVVLLPKQSVFKRNRIYVVDAQQMIVEKEVKVLQSDANTVWVQADLSLGEQVVTKKQSLLMAGVKVNPEVMPATQWVINHSFDKAGY